MSDRRSFLAGMLAAGLCPSPTWADAGSPEFVAAARAPDGRHLLFGLSGRGEAVFRFPLPGRGHAAAAHPRRPESVVFARRPGTFAIVFDCRSGRPRFRLETPDGRHFYGHGTYSADGELLFTTENDYSSARGVIGVWDASGGYVRVGELPSGGIGPHDMDLMPDGRSLVVANGGIETHPLSGRARLNLATMSPNLSYIGLSGGITDQVELEPVHRRNSIRHLSVGRDGTVAFAMQWQGDPSRRPPLLGIHARGEPARLLAASPGDHARMQGYAGSIAMAESGRLVAITSPRGGVLQVFDAAAGACLRQFRSPDVCGVSRTETGFAFTTGTGVVAGIDGTAEVWRRERDCQWDNHLVRVS